MIYFIAFLLCLGIGGYGVATRNMFLNGAGTFAAGVFFHSFLVKSFL